MPMAWQGTPVHVHTAITHWSRRLLDGSGTDGGRAYVRD